jgi:hypothetical protein
MIIMVYYIKTKIKSNNEGIKGYINAKFNINNSIFMHNCNYILRHYAYIYFECVDDYSAFKIFKNTPNAYALNKKNTNPITEIQHSYIQVFDNYYGLYYIKTNHFYNVASEDNNYITGQFIYQLKQELKSNTWELMFGLFDE